MVFPILCLNYQTNVRQLSDNCQTIIRQLSGNCRTIVRQLSDNCHMINISFSWQTTPVYCSGMGGAESRSRFQTAVEQLANDKPPQVI